MTEHNGNAWVPQAELDALALAQEAARLEGRVVEAQAAYVQAQAATRAAKAAEGRASRKLKAAADAVAAFEDDHTAHPMPVNPDLIR